jgi:hypothetical protein
MDLQKDFIPKERFQKLMITIMCLIGALIIWSGIQELNTFHSVFNADNVTEGEALNYTMEPLSITKVNLNDTIFTYVSVTDLSYRSSHLKSAEILSSATDNTKMLGLLSHPSFLVNNSDSSFWQSQFYLQIGLNVLGWLILVGFLLGVSITNIRQEQKLFTQEIYRWVFALYFLVFAGFLAHPILYGRMIHFLNTEYYLGEPLTSGISQEPLWALMILFFVIIFLQRAIPIQNEQDLTV